MTTERDPPAVPGDIERRAAQLAFKVAAAWGLEPATPIYIEALTAVRDAERERCLMLCAAEIERCEKLMGDNPFADFGTSIIKFRVEELADAIRKGEP